MAVVMNPRKGYYGGIMSGATWGLDAVLLGVVMIMAPFVEDPVLLAAGGVICSALHDIVAAFWLYIYMGAKGRLKELKLALRTRDGRFCALGAVLGGPLAMTTYTLSIAVGGAALTTSVSAIYPLLGTALAVWILKEKTGPQTWLGLLICIIGIVIIGWTPSNGENVNVSLGIVFALITAVGWASEGVVCGYGMKAGLVDPELGLLVRYTTSALVYLLVVAPVFAGGFVSAFHGFSAVFSYAPCWILLIVTAAIGMYSFLCWYTGIDNIGAAKALCLNVTYSFWGVVFSFILSKFFPQYFSGALSWLIVVGALMILGGVTMATLYKPKKSKEE
jgi:drug/metabolite transporter (DMT)-like permease